MKKRCFLIMFVFTIIAILILALFFVLSHKKTDDITIDTKDKLMELFNLSDLECNIINIKANETDESDTSKIAITLSVSSETVKGNEKLNFKSEYDETTERIFNQYSLSTREFDAIGTIFSEISNEEDGGIIYMPYEICWGISYDTEDTYSMVAFATIPRNVVVDIEHILN